MSGWNAIHDKDSEFSKSRKASEPFPQNDCLDYGFLAITSGRYESEPINETYFDIEIELSVHVYEGCLKRVSQAGNAHNIH